MNRTLCQKWLRRPIRLRRYRTEGRQTRTSCDQTNPAGTGYGEIAGLPTVDPITRLQPRFTPAH